MQTEEYNGMVVLQKNKREKMIRKNVERKRIIILALTGILLFMLAVICCLYFGEKQIQRMKNKRIAYGDDIEAIQSEFPNVPGIESCHYKVEIIGSPLYDFIGPTNYHLTAVIIIDSDEMDRIVNQYEGEKRNKLSEDEQIKIAIEQRLIDNTSIDDETIWTFNQEFRMNVLGGRYVGEVYYLEEENAIYIDAENL